jgi:hypothetical protein
MYGTLFQQLMITGLAWRPFITFVVVVGKEQIN